jgi:hypothetical protein
VWRSIAALGEVRLLFNIWAKRLREEPDHAELRPRVLYRAL